jgi:hypothetical protein
MSDRMRAALLRKLVAEDQTADDIAAWLADWARQEGAPEGTAEWLDALRAAGGLGHAMIRVLDWPRADYGNSWAELRGYLAEACKSNMTVDLDTLAYVDELHRRALKPTADWMAQRGASAEAPDPALGRCPAMLQCHRETGHQGRHEPDPGPKAPPDESLPHFPEEDFDV